MTERPGALVRWLKFLKIESCICPYRWGSMGRLYGISMGHGWIRTDAVRGCPHHES